MAPNRESENRRAIQPSDETKEMLEGYSQRIMQVETKQTQIETDVKIVVVQQGHLQSTVDKLAGVVDVVAKQLNIDEQAIVAIRERTENHADQITHLQEREVDVSKILEAHQLQLQKHESNFSIGRFLAVTTGGLALGSLFSHFFGK